MGLKDITNVSAVYLAAQEYRDLGRERFLKKYGFGSAKRYWVEVEGDRYDAKAVAGAAHFYQHGDPLSNRDFKGGEKDVAPVLEAMGFRILISPVSPPWTYLELVLALNLYLSKWRPRTKAWRRVGGLLDLSEELQRLPVYSPEQRPFEGFRNLKSVAAKMDNFDALNPEYMQNTGKSGWEKGGTATEDVWDEWSHRPEELAVLVAGIRSEEATPLGSERAEGQQEKESSEYSAVEGGLLERMHKHYERNRRLVAEKKRAVRQATGGLACEVCGFDAETSLGIKSVVDVHHIDPLHRRGVGVTILDDLAVLCPTCHRVIHAHIPLITPDRLREKYFELRGGSSRDSAGQQC